MSDHDVEQWEDQLLGTTTTVGGSNDDQGGDDLERLNRVRLELAKIEKEVSPELWAHLEDWRDDVTTALANDDADEAENWLNYLRHVIPEQEIALKTLQDARVQLAAIEQELSPELLEAVQEWRESVTKAIEAGRAEDATEALEELQKAIPEQKLELEQDKQAAEMLGTLDIPEADKFGDASEMLNILGLTDDVEHYKFSMERDGVLPRVLKLFEAQSGQLPKLPGIEIAGCSFVSSKPMFTLKSPSPVIMARGLQPPKNKVFKTSGTVFDNGTFGVYLTVTLNAGSGDCDGWTAFLTQNCAGNRQAVYSDGSKVSNISKMNPDMSSEPIELVPGKPATLALTDSPHWHYCDQVKAKVSQVSIDDLFVVYLLVNKSGVGQRCLMKMEWSFVSNGKTASFAVKAVTELKGNDNGGALVSGGKANEVNQDVYQSG